MEIPSQGGNTLFATAYRAYDALPHALRDRVEGLQAVHVYDYDGSATVRADRHSPDAPRAVHPLVIVHPETGRRALYANRLMTSEIVGWSKQDSEALLQEMFDYIEDPAYVFAHQWTPGDLVMWDNRCTLHARSDFNPTEPRVLRRVTVRGDRPVGPPSDADAAAGLAPDGRAT